MIMLILLRLNFFFFFQILNERNQFVYHFKKTGTKYNLSKFQSSLVSGLIGLGWDNVKFDFVYL
jgi:hypothetical protein